MSYDFTGASAVGTFWIRMRLWYIGIVRISYQPFGFVISIQSLYWCRVGRSDRTMRSSDDQGYGIGLCCHYAGWQPRSKYKRGRTAMFSCSSLSTHYTHTKLSAAAVAAAPPLHTIRYPIALYTLMRPVTHARPNLTSTFPYHCSYWLPNHSIYLEIIHIYILLFVWYKRAYL